VLAVLLLMLMVLMVLLVLLVLLLVVVLVHMPNARSRQWWGRARHCPRRLRLLLGVAARWGAQAEVLMVGKGGQLRGVACCGQHLLLIMLMMLMSQQKKKMWC